MPRTPEQKLVIAEERLRVARQNVDQQTAVAHEDGRRSGLSQGRVEGGVVGTAGTLVLGAVLLWGSGALGKGGPQGTPSPEPSSRPTPGLTMGPDASPSMGTTETPRPSLMPTEQPTATPDNSQESQRPGNVEQAITAEEAAAKYGADEYSSNPGNWEISFDQTDENNGRVIGAHLKPDNSGDVHRVNVTPGTVAEVYVDVQQKRGDVPFFKKNIRALVFVVDGRYVPQMDLRGGTFWTASDMPVDELRDGLVDQLLVKEQVEQPGTIILRTCPPEGFNGNGEFGPRPENVADAARLYGMDEYTKNPNNWEISFENDAATGAHLIPDPSGNTHRIRVNDAAFEGYIDVQHEPGSVDEANGIDGHPWADENRRAIAIVGDGRTMLPDEQGNVLIDLRGGTVWTGPEVEYWTLVGQVEDKEVLLPSQGGQPGTLVIPVC